MSSGVRIGCFDPVKNQLSRCEQNSTSGIQSFNGQSSIAHRFGYHPFIKKTSQLLKRLRAPFVRDVLQQFRDGSCSATQAAAELQVSKRRLYQLFHSYLKAVGQRKAQQRSPRLSCGARRGLRERAAPPNSQDCSNVTCWPASSIHCCCNRFFRTGIRF